MENNEKNKKQKDEQPINKAMEFNLEEKQYRPMYNMDIVYDEEIYNKFNEQIEDENEFEELPATGNHLVNAINLQDNLYKVYF